MTGNFDVEHVQTTAGDRFDLTIRLRFTSEQLAERVELKTSYYRQALANLEAAARDRDSSSPAMLDVVLP